MLLAPLQDLISQMGMEGASPEDIARLFNDDAIIDMLERVDAEREDERYNKFHHLFPDLADCPFEDVRGNRFKQIGESRYYARDYYQRHMDFFEAGAGYRARCLMAANRIGKCRDYNALVPHPDGTVSRIGELYDKAEPFDVWAWNGVEAVPVRASHVVRKPAEQCVEVLLSNGTSFIASLNHYVLGACGYVSLAQILASAPCLPACGSASSRSAHNEDAQRSSQTASGSPGHCSEDRRQCDGPPPAGGEIVRELPPSVSDAPRRNPAASPLDDLAHSSRRSPSLSAGLPSSRYAALRCAVRSAAFLARAAYTSARRNTGSRLEFQPLAAASLALARSARAIFQGRSGRVALASPMAKAANHVVAYRPAGIHDLYDMTVPGLENYVADGIVHHNTYSAGGFEMACHLTGLYPHWWPGRRFRHPVRAWACGKTNETTRDIVQTTLLGDVAFQGARKVVDGSGVIPRDKIGMGNGQLTWKAGVADLVDTIRIKHTSGGWSKLGLKSYQQGRGSFEGTAQHVVWDDEEPPQDVYGEQVIRTATTKGIIYLTFTPLAGISEVVQQFMNDERGAG